MNVLLPILKPIGLYLMKMVMATATASVVKEIVFSLLEMAVKSTDNPYDDRIVEALKKEMEIQEVEKND